MTRSKASIPLRTMFTPYSRMLGKTRRTGRVEKRS